MHRNLRRRTVGAIATAALLLAAGSAPRLNSR